MFNGQGQMFLCISWERFVCAHNLEVSCLLNFKYKGDNEVRVKVFDGTCCRRHYHDDGKDVEV
jgi:hypothetical protein